MITRPPEAAKKLVGNLGIGDLYDEDKRAFPEKAARQKNSAAK
ncbi:hypothetical protein ACTJJ0_01780 [Chitinophaga sp. 22321]|nr:hypothetical protein [Chitinophaga hostae]